TYFSTPPDLLCARAVPGSAGWMRAGGGAAGEPAEAAEVREQRALRDAAGGPAGGAAADHDGGGGYGHRGRARLGPLRRPEFGARAERFADRGGDADAGARGG